MPDFIDRTGCRYGRWLVLGLAPDKGPGSWWRCLCDPAQGGCGREKVVNRPQQSAGCMSCKSRNNKHAVGAVRSADHRAKMSAALKARFADPEFRAHLSRANQGRKRTPSSVAKQIATLDAKRGGPKLIRKPTGRPRGGRPKNERNAAIAAAVALGRTLESVAKEYGITKQRVSQILHRMTASK